MQTTKRISLILAGITIAALIMIGTITSCVSDKFSPGKDRVIKEVSTTLNTVDILEALGEPQVYIWEGKIYTKDNLPDTYLMYYVNNKINIMISNGVVTVIRIENFHSFPGYEGVKIGDTIDKVIETWGEPKKTITDSTILWKPGVLYLNCKDAMGDAHSHYEVPKKKARLFFFNNRVSAIYITGDFTSDLIYTLKNFITEFNKATLSKDDVISMLGEPKAYIWDGKRYSKENLPEIYIMKYNNNSIDILIYNNHVDEIRMEEGEGFVDYNGIRFGSTIDEVKNLVGEPENIVENDEIGFEANTLFINCYIPEHGKENRLSYYNLSSANSKVFFDEGKVTAIYNSAPFPPDYLTTIKEFLAK